MKQHNLRIYRGDDVDIALHLSDGSGAPLDLHGMRADLHIAKRTGAAPLLQLSTTNGGIETGADSGSLILHFSHDATQHAPWQAAQYDLQLTDSAGRRRTVLRGEIVLEGDITEV